MISLQGYMFDDMPVSGVASSKWDSYAWEWQAQTLTAVGRGCQEMLKRGWTSQESISQPITTEWVWEGQMTSNTNGIE